MFFFPVRGFLVGVVVRSVHVVVDAQGNEREKKNFSTKCDLRFYFTEVRAIYKPGCREKAHILYFQDMYGHLVTWAIVGLIGVAGNNFSVC